MCEILGVFKMPYDENGGAYVGRDTEEKPQKSGEASVAESVGSTGVAASRFADMTNKLSEGGKVGEAAANALNGAAQAVSAGPVGIIGALRAGAQGAKTAFTSTAKKAAKPVKQAGESLGGLLNVSANVGTTIVASVLASALGLGGYAFWPMITGEMTADEVAIYSARVKKDCPEALELAEAYYGDHGQYAIPEEYDGQPVGTFGSCEGTFPRINADFGCGSYDRNHGSWAGYTWELYCNKNGIADVHAINESDMSGVSEYGFSMIDDAYCIALAPELGGEVSINGGDELIFFFDNGKAIRTIACDAKSSGDSNYTIWGHSQGGCINVLEFMCYGGTGDEAPLAIDTSENVYTRLARNEGWDTIPNRVTSFSYNGPSAEFKEFYGGSHGSILDGASNASKSARLAGYNGVLDGCLVESEYTGYSGDYAYVDFMIDIALDDDWGYRMVAEPSLVNREIDCSGLVSLALYASGYDCGNGGSAYWGMSYPWRHSTLTLYTGLRNSGFEEVDKNDRSKWKYGDILLWSAGGQDGHVAVYLGQDNGREVFVHATGIWGRGADDDGSGAGVRDETKTEVCITYGSVDNWVSGMSTPSVYRINDNVKRIEISESDKAIIDGLDIDPDKSNPDYERWHSWNASK